MELWIRSQDKLKLVSNCNLYISNEMKNEYIIEDLNNKYLKLGTYKTMERALKVLNEIQNLLKPKAYIKSNMKLSQKNIKELADAYKEVFDDKVLIVNDDIDIQSLGFITYEMPQD